MALFRLMTGEKENPSLAKTDQNNPSLAIRHCVQREKNEGRIQGSKYGISSYIWDDLGYCRYRGPTTGVEAYGTLFKFERHQEAADQWGCVKHYDKNIVIHPVEEVIEGNDAYLIYPLVLTNIQFFLKKHKELGWSDNVGLGILRQTGQVVRYLFREKLFHGNLSRGICVSPDLQVFLWNFKRGIATLIDDINQLCTVVQLIQRFSLDTDMKERIKMFISFLQRYKCAKNSEYSSIYGGDRSVMFLNYPTLFELEDNLTFVANIFTLSVGTHSLTSSGDFRTCLNARYNEWEVMVKSDPVLLAVYQHDSNDKDNYSDKYGNVYGYSFAKYVHNVIKHYSQKAKELGIEELKEEEVLKELLKLWPTLLEDFYEALFVAMDRGGYTHDKYSISDILCKRLAN